jgi:iron complex outermembrane receptor protein
MAMTPHRTLLAAAVLAAFTPAQAQDAAPVADSVATVVVLGSRTTARSALDTAVPVGLIGQKDLQTAGTTKADYRF